MTPRRTPSRILARAGLTLIEVLLAVTIMSLGLTVLLTAVSRCLAVMKQAKNYQMAQTTMDQGELEHPLMVTNDVDELEVSPVTYDNGFVFSRSVDSDDDDDGLYVIRTRVRWSQHNRESYEERVQYVYQEPEEE